MIQILCRLSYALGCTLVIFYITLDTGSTLRCGVLCFAGICKLLQMISFFPLWIRRRYIDYHSHVWASFSFHNTGTACKSVCFVLGSAASKTLENRLDPWWVPRSFGQNLWSWSIQLLRYIRYGLNFGTTHPFILNDIDFVDNCKGRYSLRQAVIIELKVYAKMYLICLK
jgi:hypothetical protein